MSYCAQVIHPEGGPKDGNPPELISSSIESGTTNFKGKEIKLTFDKKVKISNLNNINISPSVESKNDLGFEVYIKGKTLTLEFTSPLKDNTTYTINFGNAITDTTEFNVAKNIVISFSTGDTIDEMKLSGTIYDYFSKQLIKNAVVSLYRIHDENNFSLSQKPNYTVFSDENGQYSFTNIKKGFYKIIAHQNNDHSLTLDTKNNKYGFFPESINLNKKTEKKYDIAILNSDPTPLNIIKADSKNQDYQISFNKEIRFFEINLDSKIAEACLSLDKKEILILSKLEVFDPYLEKDLEIFVIDSFGNEATKKTKIALNSFRGPSINSDFKILTDNKKQISKAGFFKIHSTKPINVAKIDLTKFSLSINKKEIPILKENISIKNKNQIIIKYDFSQFIDSKLDNISKLIIDEDAITDTSGEKNKKIGKAFLVDKKNLGSISGSVNDSSKNYKIQLINDLGEIVDEVSKNEIENNSYVFNNVLPGKYKVRVLLYDKNDKVWFSGNINFFSPPDRLIELNKEIEIIEAWQSRENNIYFVA